MHKFSLNFHLRISRIFKIKNRMFRMTSQQFGKQIFQQKNSNQKHKKRL